MIEVVNDEFDSRMHVVADTCCPRCRSLSFRSAPWLHAQAPGHRVVICNPCEMPYAMPLEPVKLALVKP